MKSALLIIPVMALAGCTSVTIPPDTENVTVNINTSVWKSQSGNDEASLDTVTDVAADAAFPLTADDTND